MANVASEPARIPARTPYGAGIYRRRIELRAADGEVCVGMVDDFHQFSVRLMHDGRTITGIAVEPVRVPWVTCPGAVEPLQRMRGAPIEAPLRELYDFTAARDQCTHMHDLVCLAALHAARFRATGGAERRYDATLPDRQDGRSRPALVRDGREVLAWSLNKYEIVASEPSDFAGNSLASRKLRQTILEHPDAELGEAAFVLQRAVFIGTGRMHDFEAMPSAAAFASVVGAACHSFAPERAQQALRVRNTVRDFTDRSAAAFADE